MLLNVRVQYLNIQILSNFKAAFKAQSKLNGSKAFVRNDQLCKYFGKQNMKKIDWKIGVDNGHGP